jgi:hypothetical protein
MCPRDRGYEGAAVTKTERKDPSRWVKVGGRYFIVVALTIAITECFLVSASPVLSSTSAPFIDIDKAPGSQTINGGE